MSTAKKTPTTQAPAQPKDAVAMLKADHKKVSDLFDEFEQTQSSLKALLNFKWAAGHEG